MQRLKLLSFSMAAHEAECRGLSLTGNVPVEGGPVTLWDTETPTHAKLMPSPGFLEGDSPRAVQSCRMVQAIRAELS